MPTLALVLVGFAPSIEAGTSLRPPQAATNVGRAITGRSNSASTGCRETIHGVTSTSGSLAADWLPENYRLVSGNTSIPTGPIAYSLNGARDDAPRLDLNFSYISGPLRPSVGGRRSARVIEVQGHRALLETGPPSPALIGVYWKVAGNELLSVVGSRVAASAVVKVADHVVFTAPGIVSLPVTPGRVVSRARAETSALSLLNRNAYTASAKLSDWSEVSALIDATEKAAKTLEVTTTVSAAPWTPAWAVLTTPKRTGVSPIFLVLIAGTSGSVAAKIRLHGPANWFEHLTDRGGLNRGCPGGSSVRVPFGVLTREEATYVAHMTTTYPPLSHDVSTTWVIKLTTVPALNRADPGLYGGCVEQDCDLDELIWPTIEIVHASRGRTVACLPPGASVPPNYRPKQVKQYYTISVPDNYEIGCGALPKWVEKLKDLAPARVR